VSKLAGTTPGTAFDRLAVTGTATLAGTLNVTLNAEHLARLDKASAIEPGFPHDFLSTEGIRNLAYGGTYDQIDNHRIR